MPASTHRHTMSKKNCRCSSCVTLPLYLIR